MNPFIVLFLGFLLIFIEFYIPGAIMGIAGGLMVFTAIVLFAIESQSPIAVAGFIIGTAIFLGLLVKFALWRIRTANPEHSIYSNSNQEGYVASSYDASTIGKKGVVVTDLKPGGQIIVEGKRIQALSQSGYITKGSEVTVIGGEEDNLIVKLTKKETSS